MKKKISNGLTDAERKLLSLTPKERAELEKKLHAKPKSVKHDVVSKPKLTKTKLSKHGGEKQIEKLIRDVDDLKTMVKEQYEVLSKTLIMLLKYAEDKNIKEVKSWK